MQAGDDLLLQVIVSVLEKRVDDFQSHSERHHRLSEMSKPDIAAVSGETQ